MSLEQAITNLTEAVKAQNLLVIELIKVMAPVEVTGRTLEQDIEAHDAKPVVAEQPAEKPAEPVVETQPSGKIYGEAALKTSMVALVNKSGREAMDAILKEYGATKFSELPKGKYNEIGAKVDALLAE